MSADVITTYSHTAWCSDCDWLSEQCNTIEAARLLATDHNVLHHDDGAAA